MKSDKNEMKDFLLLNLSFIIACILILLLPFGLIGIKLFILVLIYNLFVLLFSYWKEYSEWRNVWSFSLILSIFQVFPDWFLSAQLNVLVFPEDGFLKIGTVSAYMAGLWVIPLFTILFIGLKINEKYTEYTSYTVVGVISLIIFGVAELTIWSIGSWYAQNVKTIFGHLAIYIIFPEILLGLVAFYGYKVIKDRNNIWMVPSSFLVMLVYLGAATFFYLIFETLLFNA
ncbi:MAG: conserved membrane protein of unknown function [Promethearchaeota archaeon]|nr:MAG: conserved membrane protein of unknown function [Candidatus Lokiarchaeota archaeon]